jgi:hypothetical protein
VYTLDINLRDCTNILLAACWLGQLGACALHHPNTAILIREHGTGQSRDRDFNQFGRARTPPGAVLVHGTLWSNGRPKWVRFVILAGLYAIKRVRPSCPNDPSLSFVAASVAGPRGLRRSRLSVRNRPRPPPPGCRSSPQPAEVTDESLCRYIIILTAAFLPLPPRYRIGRQANSLNPILCASGLIGQNGFLGLPHQ